jgi:uncharacterized membrane protein
VTRSEDSPVAHDETAWAALPTTTQARQWEEVAPGAFNRIMMEIERGQRHKRYLEWAEFASRVFGQLCGLVTVVVLAVLAKYFVDHDAATAGAGIVTAGVASIVAVFITGRLTQQR